VVVDQKARKGYPKEWMRTLDEVKVTQRRFALRKSHVWAESRLQVTGGPCKMAR
jgi:hypothetical protein